MLVSGGELSLRNPACLVNLHGDLALAEAEEPPSSEDPWAAAA